MSSPTFHVLCYHGVYDDALEINELNSSGKHISRSQFVEQMSYLASKKNLVTMSDIAGASRGQITLPDGAVAVTFDDGFLNNYYEAWPILNSYGIPVTFYLCTGYVNTERCMRMDIIEAVIFLANLDELTAHVGKRRLLFDLRTPKKRNDAFIELKSLCKQVERNVVEGIINGLVDQVTDQSIFNHALYKFMTWDNIREIDQSPLSEFGAHTVDHYPLSTLSQKELEWQIKSSIRTVERELKHMCRHFAYPEGRECDYDQRAIDYLKKMNISVVPNAVSGTNRLDAIDPYNIERILVGMDNNSFPYW